jgi:uncharacterized protein (TIGR02646 family)
MKYIEKQPEPPIFAEWKAQANAEWKPRYDDLRNPEKPALKKALMAEQGALCCYCERRLIESDSHIEHFKPQESFKDETLEYGNLLCSCQQELEKGEPRHCGNLKDKWYDAALTVSPLDPDCEARFAYTHDGRIHPAVATDEGASQTIKRLGLSIPKLNALRRSAIEPFIDDALTVDDMQQFVTGYLERDPGGHFNEFFTTIRHLFGHYTQV